MIVGFDIDGPVAQSMVFFHYVLVVGKFFARIFGIKENRRKFLEKIFDLVLDVMAFLNIFFKGSLGSKEFFQFAKEQNIEIVFISARRKKWLIYTIRQVEKVTKIKNPIILLADKKNSKTTNLKRYANALDIFVDDEEGYLDVIEKRNPKCRRFLVKLMSNQKNNKKETKFLLKKTDPPKHTKIFDLREIKKEILNADT